MFPSYEIDPACMHAMRCAKERCECGQERLTFAWQRLRCSYMYNMYMYMYILHGGWPMAAGPVSRLGSFEPGDKTGLQLSPHLAPST